MPLTGERVRPRRAPRLGYPPERPVFTREQALLRTAIRRSAEYQRRRRLIQTPEGALQFWLQWRRVDPREAIKAIFGWQDWLVRTQSPTEELLEGARTLMEVVLRG